jgi:putative FmdB family regulatory protein
MPLYDYRAMNAQHSCAHCRDSFEVRQAMADEPLRTCPSCGAPVNRVITTVGIATHQLSKNITSDKNLKKHGFTKLVNEGGGRYRKI